MESRGAALPAVRPLVVARRRPEPRVPRLLVVGGAVIDHPPIGQLRRDPGDQSLPPGARGSRLSRGGLAPSGR